MAPEPSLVAGIDEVGYGALAGPLLTAVVVVPANWRMPGLKDSKAFKDERSRQIVLWGLLCDPLFRYALVYKSPLEIDAGPRQALVNSHIEATSLGRKLGATSVLIDGNIPIKGAESIVKGDTKIPAIMAASILAKVTRDAYMSHASRFIKVDYGWEQNKGYGTAVHQEALQEHGLTSLHRRSYCKKFLTDKMAI